MCPTQIIPLLLKNDPQKKQPRARTHTLNTHTFFSAPADHDYGTLIMMFIRDMMKYKT